MLWLDKMTKSLFIYFSFFTTQEGVWESITSQVSQSHDGKSHGGCGKVVHRLCSSCISSV